MEKISDCIKILNNPDIVNYRTCRVVFFSLTIYEHRDTKTGENVHLPHMHKLAHNLHSQNIRLIGGDGVIKIDDV